MHEILVINIEPLSIFNLGGNIQVLAFDISLYDSSQFCRMGMNR